MVVVKIGGFTSFVDFNLAETAREPNKCISFDCMCKLVELT